MVLGLPGASQQQDLCLSYVIWQEGIDPFLAKTKIHLTSNLRVGCGMNFCS